MTASERQLIERLRQHAPKIGDDIAELPSGKWIVTGDHQIPGVHLPADAPPHVVAKRLLAVNLSDLAAGGAVPRFGFLNVAVPHGYPLNLFVDTLMAECASAGVEICGGDTGSAPSPVFSLMLLGELAPDSRSPRRQNAQAGDLLWLTGTIGESALGRHLLQVSGQPWAWLDQNPDPKLPFDLGDVELEAAWRAVHRHLFPTPHLEAGRWAATLPRAAAIDISDGLSLDLHRLLEASGVGAEIDAARLPFAPHHQSLCAALDIDPLAIALSGGEDYVLLVATPAYTHLPAELEGTQIGRVLEASSIAITHDGQTRLLDRGGWDHLDEH